MTKVLISEWSRNAAHNLDDRRDAWLSAKAKTPFTERYLLSLRVRDDIDHSSLFAMKVYNIAKLLADVTHDRGVVQDYLVSLKLTKRIDGTVYPKAAFDAYRHSVVEHMHYLEALAASLKVIKKHYQWENSFSRHKDVAHLNDTEIISQLHSLFKKYAKKNQWWEQVDDDDQMFLDGVLDLLRKRSV